MVNKANITVGVNPRTNLGSVVPSAAKKDSGFAAVLAEKTNAQNPLKLSSHAQKRLSLSEVKLTDSDVQRIDGAFARAVEKGSNQSLIMLDNLALVVSVKNKVVITAVDGDRMKEGVFTNIDSVVIA